LREMGAKGEEGPFGDNSTQAVVASAKEGCPSIRSESNQKNNRDPRKTD